MEDYTLYELAELYDIESQVSQAIELKEQEEKENEEKINDQLKFLLLSHGFIFNNNINNNNITRGINDK